MVRSVLSSVSQGLKRTGIKIYIFLRINFMSMKSYIVIVLGILALIKTRAKGLIKKSAFNKLVCIFKKKNFGLKLLYKIIKYNLHMLFIYCCNVHYLSNYFGPLTDLLIYSSLQKRRYQSNCCKIIHVPLYT